MTKRDYIMAYCRRCGATTAAEPATARLDVGRLVASAAETDWQVSLVFGPVDVRACLCPNEAAK